MVNMKKGISWYIVFLLVVIGLTISGILLIFWNAFEFVPKEGSRISCQMKYINYCFRWARDKKDPGDWDEVNPTEGCEEFNIYKPTEEDCKKFFIFS